jgi:hypothetical protein
VTPQIVHRRPVNESHGGQRAQTLRNDGFVVGVPPILPAIQILTMVFTQWPITDRELGHSDEREIRPPFSYLETRFVTFERLGYFGVR